MILRYFGLSQHIKFTTQSFKGALLHLKKKARAFGMLYNIFLSLIFCIIHHCQKKLHVTIYCVCVCVCIQWATELHNLTLRLLN
jgi:hypothetical protein